MSWNTSRILNNLEYEINENKQDISTLERKTFYISDLLGSNGTVFANNVYSEAFVKNGGTSSQYLMADGSTTTNSQQGHQTFICTITIIQGHPSRHQDKYVQMIQIIKM